MVCSSSSFPDIGALASGELRVGRVLGLPSPSPKGVCKVVELTAVDDAGLGLDKGLVSFTGVPGGVVLGARVFLEAGPSLCKACGGRVTSIAGTSG